MIPATAASAAPITKASEMVRSTSMPSREAMVRSCSQARWARPSTVAPISVAKAAISATVSTMMKIWM